MSMRSFFQHITVLTSACLIIGCSSSGNSSSATSAPAPVLTSAGYVQGAYNTYPSGATVVEYRGIPYAEAPIGDLRWSLPVAKSSWTGTLDATKFGDACPQVARFNLTDSSTNEDCLTINVSIPSDIRAGEKLPVLFWIHGGAFVGGSSNLYRLDKLADEGRMVVVTANYRLGFFGFVPLKAFESNAVNGNYGLEDQRLAMKWVQTNIEAFGGDKNNVTIAGESAGAASICMHLASPTQVSGLFQKAIITSAGCLATIKTVDKGIETAEIIAGSAEPEYLNCPNSSANLSCLRGKSVSAILTAQTKYTSKNPADLAPFIPVYGTISRPNATLPTSIVDALNQTNGGQFKVVPTMIGGEQKELLLYVGYWWQDSLLGGPAVDNATINSFWLPYFYGNQASQVATQYGFNNPSTGAEKLGEALSDYNPKLGINNCLYYSTADKIKAYPGSSPLYLFEFQDPDALVNGVGISTPYPPFALGPVHSAMINYLFPNYSNNKKIDAPNLSPQSEILAKEIVQYWSAFAYNGNPAKLGLPLWPAYEGSGAAVQKFIPQNIGSFNGSNTHNCSFWNSLYPALNL